MPTECFGESSGWLALLNQTDQDHELAHQIVHDPDRKFGLLVTTTAVLNEVANSLSPVATRRAAVVWRHRLVTNRSVELAFVDENLWDAGWELYEDRPDKAWSLTDCISFVVMEQRGIRDALTNDRHFAQAGFRALLRSGS